jgi:hypothetical protein
MKFVKAASGVVLLAAVAFDFYNERRSGGRQQALSSQSGLPTSAFTSLAGDGRQPGGMYAITAWVSS